MTTRAKMAAKTNTERPLVGLIRVSTSRQAIGGGSLAEQEDMLRGFAASLGRDLIEIYRECGSASISPSRRPVLQDAIVAARARGAGLLVSSIDRLSRNKDVLPLLRGIRVVSVAEGAVGKGRLELLLRRAEAESTRASENSRAQHARSRASGKTAAAPRHLPEARRKGVQQNILRSRIRIERLADALEQHPDLRRLTHAGRAARLNELGLRNLRNLASGNSVDWTRDALRAIWPVVCSEVARRRAARCCGTAGPQPVSLGVRRRSAASTRVFAMPSGVGSTSGDADIAEAQGAVSEAAGDP